MANVPSRLKVRTQIALGTSKSLRLSFHNQILIHIVIGDDGDRVHHIYTVTLWRIANNVISNDR